MRNWLPYAAVAAITLSVGAFTGARADDIGKKKTDPVSQKVVTVAKDTPVVNVSGDKYYFADVKSRDTFLKAPESYLKKPQVCPIKGNAGLANKGNRIVVNDQIYYFCCMECPKEFAKDPSLAGKVSDPVSGKEFSPSADGPKSTFKGSLYFFDSKESKDAFDKEPAKYAKVILQ